MASKTATRSSLLLWFGMHFLTKFALLTEEMETFRNSSGNYGCVRLIVLRNKNVKKVCCKSALSWFLDSYIATGILLFKADFLMLFVDEYQNSVVLEVIPMMLITTNFSPAWSLLLVLIRRCIFVFPARTGRCDCEANERREALTRTEIFLKSRCRNNP